MRAALKEKAESEWRSVSLGQIAVANDGPAYENVAKHD